jgi:hypothetical protein
MKALQWALWILGLGLQTLLVTTLFQGVGRQFPAIVAYVLCLLATTIVEIVAVVIFGKFSSSFETYYWSAEVIRQTALFALVVSLAAHVIPRDARGQAYERLLTVVAATIWIGSLFAYYDSRLNTWMTPVVRNLSFFTGMLNLLVWFAYARLRSSDVTRLMITAGLGLQMTGEAIGQAIRLINYSSNSKLAGALLVVLSHMLCLFIWWRAFRAEQSMRPRGPAPLPPRVPPGDAAEIGLGSLETYRSFPG